jgi:hypothetical protein
MKIKKFSKRLVFNKETIAHLDDTKLRQIQGGESDTVCSETFCTSNCPTNACCNTNCVYGC